MVLVCLTIIYYIFFLLPFKAIFCVNADHLGSKTKQYLRKTYARLCRFLKMGRYVRQQRKT